VTVTKSALLAQYRRIYPTILSQGGTGTSKQKGKQSNLEHNNLLDRLNSRLIQNGEPFHALLMNNYCCSLSMLETRHKLHPYVDIEFSRRIGELWEKFCKVSLNNPFSGISQSNPVNISAFYDQLSKDMQLLSTTASPKNTPQNATFHLIKDLLGDVDLTLDYSGRDANNQLIGIDFKSGFGSNEKGNTQRILQVGKIYKYIAPHVQLKLVIRQNDNNNYLSKIEDSGVWGVVTGKKSYAYLSEISGCDILSFVTNEVNFKADMDSAIYRDLGSKVTNRDRYLDW
jgi:hypothetical protein